MTKKILLLTFLGLFVLPGSSFATVDSSKPIIQYYTPSISTGSYQYKLKVDPRGQAKINYTFKDFDGGVHKRQYQVYLPKSFNSKTRYPLVVLLHGPERTGVSMVQKWIPLAEKVGIVLIGPSHPSKSWPVNELEADIIEGMIEEVREKIEVHPLRTYMFGTASGGELALSMTYLKPDLFAAISVHGAYLRHNEDYLRSDEPYHKTPVAFINGTHDTRAPIAKVRDSADFFARQGHDTIVIEISGHNDWYYSIANEINSKVMQFMSLFKTE